MDKFFYSLRNISYYNLTGYLFKQTFKKEQRRGYDEVLNIALGTYGNCLITFFSPFYFYEKTTLANVKSKYSFRALLIGILDYVRGLKEVVQSMTSPLRNCM